jgi:hypothetical protein
MARSAVVFAALFVAAPAVAQPTPASVSLPSEGASGLFDSDWVLMNWALKYHDRDGDILLSQGEARSARSLTRTRTGG